MKIFFRKEALPMNQELQSMIIAGVTVYYSCKLIDALLNLISNFPFQ